MTTGIEWTDETWNPVVGCQHVSPGCDGCYAAREAHGRLSRHPLYQGLTSSSLGELPRFTGEVRTVPERLDQPLHWRRPRRVFVNSMSDLFHSKVPASFIAEVWATMGAAHWHTFQVLTKRPHRAALLLRHDLFASMVDARAHNLVARTNDRELMPVWVDGDHRNYERWLPNVWIGTSIEEQRYTFRASYLADTLAAVRFLSIEPLIGPIDLDHHSTDEWRTAIHWVIVGAESGPGARPMRNDWVRALRDQCADAGVPFFVKQLTGRGGHPVKDIERFPEDLRIREYPATPVAVHP